MIGSKIEAKWFLTVFGQNLWTNPLGLGQNFKFANTFYMAKGAEK